MTPYGIIGGKEEEAKSTMYKVMIPSIKHL